MATYYNITATIAFDQIEADSPHEAAAKAYQAILAKVADPERILVWEKNSTANGGIDLTSTAWTFAADPQAIIYTPEPEALETEAPLPETDVPLPLILEGDPAALAGTEAIPA